MKTYRAFFKPAPGQGIPKLLLLTASSLRSARVRAEQKLRLRYPEVLIVRVEEALLDMDQFYKEVEARR